MTAVITNITASETKTAATALIEKGYAEPIDHATRRRTCAHCEIRAKFSHWPHVRRFRTKKPPGDRGLFRCD